MTSAAPRWTNGTLQSSRFDDVYFSREDGVAESEYVFLQGSRLAERFAALASGECFTICELGLGTGLNFLLTLRLWRSVAPATARLSYIGIDAQPIDREAMADILAAWPELESEATWLLNAWPEALPGCHRRHCDLAAVTLDCWWEPAEDTLGDLASHGQRWVDAWFLDGFAPSRNPNMWSDAIWDAMARLSRPNASVATFTAAGDVRRGLNQAGFAMAKRPGFGRKRESLMGHFEGSAANDAPRMTPWDLVPPTKSRQAVVIGAGLAGAHVARALARRGFAVTVLEASEIASGGSSNRQGITYTRLSRRFGVLSDFALASYQYSLAHYRQLFKEHDLSPGTDGEFCGYLQLSEDSETLDHLRQVLDGHSRFAEIVDRQQSHTLTGVETASGGIWYPEAAWLHPGAVCHALLDHPGIEVRTHLGPVALKRSAEWHICDCNGQEILCTPTVVVASAFATRAIEELDSLPLQVIRGQTTHITSVPPLDQLRAVICHQGYLPPAVDGQHCIGASFGPNDPQLDEREIDHEHNLALLRQAIPALATHPPRAGGRVALRCNSSDYLPVAGPAVDAARFGSVYGAIRSRGKSVVDAMPEVHPGLWCLAGLGSRGLTAAPLAAEAMAAQICGEPVPWPRYLQRALSPARFLARRLKRGDL